MADILNNENYKKIFKYINFFILHVIGFSLMFKYETKYAIRKGPGIGAAVGLVIGAILGIAIGAFLGNSIIPGMIIGIVLGIIIGAIFGTRKDILKFPYLVKTKNNLEMIGVGMTIAVNILTNIFLFTDILNSPKKYDIVLYVLIFLLAGLFIIEVFTLMTLTNLHHKYKLKGSPIQFTQENREKFNLFKSLFITLIVLTSIIAGLFFTLPFSNGEYQQFFCFSDGCNIPFSVVKVLLSLTALGIMGYLIYHTYMFSQLRKSQLTDVEKEKDDYDYKSMIGKSPGFFENINLYFLSNYNPVA